MNIEITIRTYLKELALQHNEDLIKRILAFMEDNLVVKNAVGNEEAIAKLFCRTIESLNQDDTLEADLQGAILAAFENIKGIANNTHDNGELMCIYLLNRLSLNRVSFKEIPEDEFILLLDNLERIRCLFKIIDSDNNYVFPIGKLLFKLINSENLLNEIEKASSIQALMLALQIFDGSQYSQEKNHILNMIDGKNLKFIEYLFNRCIRLGGEDWKENYEKNGLLILYDTNTNKVLIRNDKSSYFKTQFDVNSYGVSEVSFEKNENDEPIAYFVEYSIGDLNSVDLADVFSAEDNILDISQVIDIIYYYQNYNIAYESALFNRDGKIYPIDPYGMNDQYIVYAGYSFKDGKKYISELLYKYGLLKVSGSGLKYINLGVLVKLEEISAIPFDEFKLNNTSTLSDLIENWLEHCENKQRCFDEFLRSFEEQIKYVYERSKLFAKKYENEYLIPCGLSESLLTNLGFDDKLLMFPIEKYKIRKDFFQDRIVVINSAEEELEDYTLEDIAGEDINILDEVEVPAVVDDKEKKLYVGRQVDHFYYLANKIKKINNAVLDADIKETVRELDVKNIAKKMECFKDALLSIHQGIPISSIARYRILNHLMLLKLSDSDISEWLGLIKKHEIEDFSIVVHNNPLDGKEGTLYIPKDRMRNESTLKHINERYFDNHIQRSKIDIFDQTIEKKGGEYYSRGEKIEHIVFIFDTIQSGKSTKDTIDRYIKNTSKVDSNLSFICDGKEVSVSEILSTNKCDAEVFSIYASAKGIKAVKNHVEKEYSSLNITVLDPIKELKSVVDKNDKKLIEKLYKGPLKGSIGENHYLVVREFNQPKRNIMCNELLDINRVTAIFCKKEELIS